MKRMIARMAVIASVVGLLLVISPSRGHKSTVLPRVHAQEGCSVATLNGTYGFYRTGTTPFGPLVGVGFSTFDGKGSSTGRQTIRRNGVTTNDLFTTPAGPGIYEVDPDCAARFLNPDGSVFGHAVVVDGGKEIFFMSLSDANTIYGVMKKVNRDED
jgi:hypothetical protein